MTTTAKKKRRTKTSLSALIWLTILVSVTYFLAASPTLDWNWRIWTLAIVGELFLAEVATNLTIGIGLSYVLGSIGTFLWVLIYRGGRWVWNKFSEENEPIEIKREVPVVASRSKDLAAAHPKLSRPRAQVVLGYGEKQRPIAIDLSRESTLIVASTRGGKTNALASMLIQLLYKSNPPEIYVIDLKANPREPLVRFSPLVHYVGPEEEDALDCLQRLVELMNERQRKGTIDPPILIFIDEMADLTTGMGSNRRRSEALLKQLSKKGLAAKMGMVVATQHARFDVLPKEIAYNLLRKIVLVVDTVSQAEVAIGYKPQRDELPENPGEFIMRGEKKGLVPGKTLLVEDGEVQELLESRFASFGDDRLTLWRVVSLGKSIGDTVSGVNTTSTSLRERGEDWASQQFVQCAYRNYALAGLLEAPSRGGSYRLKVEFVDGVEILRGYLGDECWQADPPSIVE